MKKKNYPILILSLLISQVAFSQLVSFDKDGKKIKLISEKIEVETRPVTEKVQNGATILPSLVGSVIGLGIDLVKSALDARQQSFTATYSGTYTGNDFLDNNHFNLGQLVIKRLTSQTKDAPGDLASEIVLDFIPDPKGAVFRLKVDTIQFNYAKARIRKMGGAGKTVDINVDVQINAQWKDSVKGDADSYTIKSATLGQSAITIPGLYPGQPYDFSKNEDNSLYSDWFQVVPQAPGNMLSETRGPRGWYTIKVTVKEANPYGVTANNLSAFFKSNGTDLSSLLKSFVPSGSK